MGTQVRRGGARLVLLGVGVVLVAVAGLLAWRFSGEPLLDAPVPESALDVGLRSALTPTGAPAPSAAACLAAAGVEAKDCWSLRAAALAREEGVAQASAVGRRVLSEVPAQLRPDACPRVMRAAAAASVPWVPAADLWEELLSRGEECDYALLHGAATALVASPGPGGWLEAAQQWCGRQAVGTLTPDAFASQCWHGAGVAVAVVSGLDLSVSEEFCASAPTPNEQVNCAEGVFGELLAALERSSALPRDVLQRVCSRWSVELVSQCWRYAARAWPAPVEDRPGQMAAVCATLDSERVPGCWRGVGEVLVLGVAGRADAEARSYVRDGCATAPLAVAREACLERGFVSLFSTALAVGEPADVDVFCADLPATDRPVVCPLLERFAGFVAGKGVAAG